MRVTPMPLRHGGLATLHASFTDAETGGGHVTGAEFSWGPAPAAPGTGTPMTVGPDSSAVDVSVNVPTWSLPTGAATLWARAKDTAGNWGVAVALPVSVIGAVATGVGDPEAVDFMAPASPNPFRAATTIRFGLSRPGAVRLELFDLSGRRVRTLADAVMAPGEHVATWDGRDDHGAPAASGVYFLRLVTPATTYHARVVALR
ncbi:MAG TPA: FlgD immunoglobulin-like domain containing protein, partial [Dongiaceae bacterium]|nr:FlgD immunoglobulin-like domain containing protein [Dongiaceae bacterium]